MAAWYGNPLSEPWHHPHSTTHRVNSLKTSREAVVQELKKRNVEAAPTRYSPWGVEVKEGSDFRVFAQDVYKLGCVRACVHAFRDGWYCQSVVEVEECLPLTNTF